MQIKMRWNINTRIATNIRRMVQQVHHEMVQQAHHEIDAKILLVFISVFIGFGLVIISGLPSVARAVTVGPGRIEYRADPGAVINGTLVLINESEIKQTFYPAFEKFTEKKGERQFLPGEPTELTNWFKLPTSVVLEAKEQKQILFTVEVPEKAPPGGHFAVIWWGTAAPESKQVAITARAGILVFLNVSGEINESGKLVLFQTENNKFFFLKLPEIFEVKFKDVGNTYLKPKGEITIKNIFGAKTAEFSVNEAGLIFLPETEKNLRVEKKFDKPPFAFGFYKAELALNWGEEKPDSISKNIWFLVFPWKPALGGILILLILFFGLKKGLKKYNEWVIKKYTGKD